MPGVKTAASQSGAPGKLRVVSVTYESSEGRNLPRYHAKNGLRSPIMCIVNISNLVKKIRSIKAAPKQLP